MNIRIILPGCVFFWLAVVRATATYADALAAANGNDADLTETVTRLATELERLDGHGTNAEETADIFGEARRLAPYFETLAERHGIRLYHDLLLETRGDDIVRRLIHISLVRYIPEVGEIDEVAHVMRVLDRHAREDNNADVYARDRTRISEERIGAHLLRHTAILLGVPPSVRSEVPLKEGNAGETMKVVLDWVIKNSTDAQMVERAGKALAILEEPSLRERVGNIPSRLDTAKRRPVKTPPVASPHGKSQDGWMSHVIFPVACGFFLLFLASRFLKLRNAKAR